MALATGAAIAGGVALAGAATQTIDGISDTKQGKEALANYQRQDLENSNVYKNMQISTLGSDLMREENARFMGSSIDAIRGGGVNSVLSALPKLQAQTNLNNRRAQVELDNQVTRRNYAIAGDDARIRSMVEQRENADLAGIGQQIAVGKQNTFSGIRAGANALFSASSGLEGNIGGGSKAQGTSSQTSSPFNFMSQMGLPQDLSIPEVPKLAASDPYNDFLKIQDEQQMYNDASPKNFGF